MDAKSNCPPLVPSALPTRKPRHDHSVSLRPVWHGSTSPQHVSLAAAPPLRGDQSVPPQLSRPHSGVAWVPRHFPPRLTRRFSSASSSYIVAIPHTDKALPVLRKQFLGTLLARFEVQENTPSNPGVYGAFAFIATPKNAWLSPP